MIKHGCYLWEHWKPCGLHDKVRFVLRLFMRIADPEMTFGGLELFQVVVFVFEQNGEPAL
jgi:hypothetical protein